MAKFEAGDLVKLKSGGPVMTVDGVSTTSAKPTYYCVWFRGATQQRSQFSEKALEAAEKEGESG